ncbi:MAG: radical SAM family heme chaperone HemW [Ruminococcaceae bacterium]|nr:radical SAM family heme chaperone HemW [Oscillospiraceae bacterium]
MKNLGLYIHIPFCEQKCPYCDFYSECDKNEYDTYASKLIDRIVFFSNLYKRQIDTVYFGGGTPSVLGTKRLSMILKSIKDNFLVNKDAEITVEANPCTAKQLDFKTLSNAGFNRLSVGLQSSDENELKILGRRHTANDAKETVTAAKNAGFKNISLDLMICIPTQTKSSLTESIKFCKDCEVAHISAYILKVEENTPFYRMKENLNLFDDDTQADIYLHMVSELSKHGYEQYEISNFCNPGFEGKHNLKYWHDEEYLGIGPSAHSYINGKRFYYGRSINDFYNNILLEDGNGGDIEEYIMLAMRLKEGLNLNELEKKYNYRLSNNFQLRLNNLKKEGMINIIDNTISLTTRGFLVSNTIISYLCDAL